MKKKVQYPVILTIVTLLASIGVSTTYLTTKEKIREKELEVRTRALFTVLPGIDKTPEEITPPTAKNQDKIYKGVNSEGELIGYAASGEAQGYSSKINVMVGIDSNLEKILGIDIISQRETPGLGTKMVEKESSDTLLSVLMSLFGKTSGVGHGKIQQLPEFNMHQGKEVNNAGNGAAAELRPWFQEQFKDKTYNQLVVSKVADKEKITAITGATISTNAAVKAVQNAIEKIKLELQEHTWQIK
ncbi:MAG: FMN-binding protein [Candidatus Kuenenia sp.]|nr:FMN-binding protein [Candidatus Kuenenia sp.]